VWEDVDVGGRPARWGRRDATLTTRCVRENASADEVLASADADGAPFAASAELRDFVRHALEELASA